MINMGAVIGFAIGIVVSIPFFLFQWIIVWQKREQKKEDKETGQEGNKKLAWIFIVQVVKLFVYAMVLIAMSRTDTAHMLGTATGLFVGILANGIISFKKGPRYGREDR